MTQLAVTAVGTDRPGIVAAVTHVLHERGGNLEDSAMTILNGHFAIVLIVATDDAPGELAAALEQHTTPLGLTVSVTPVEPGAATPYPTHLLSVYGADQPGIVAAVTGAIADLGVNITDLETKMIGEEDAVYAMVVELVADDEATLEAELARVCAELDVDHTLRTIDAETY